MRLPWKQTNVIERFWPELNSRVNYPIKRAFNCLIDQYDYELSYPVLKPCISSLTMYIAADATSHLINSWNLHRVPGSMGCVPVQNMQATRRNVLLTDNLVPPTPRAVRLCMASTNHLMIWYIWYFHNIQNKLRDNSVLGDAINLCKMP